MRYIPYVLIVILVLAAGLLAGMFLLGAPDPSSDVSAAVSRITTTTTVPLSTRVAALEKRVAALEASVYTTTTTMPPTTTTAAPAARCTVPTPAATSATSRRAFWSMCR